MRLFCLLWLPLFYFFWSALVTERNNGAGGILALSLGSIAALTLFFLGALVEPGDFGVSRWISGFVDLVSVPVLLPLAVFLLLLPLRVSGNFANFALLWLIPDMVIRQVSWSVYNNPLLLVLVPLLRTALVVGISACISLIKSKKIQAVILGILGILGLPLTGAASYWAFFKQDSFLGYLFLVITAVPMTAAILALLYQRQREIKGELGI